MPPSRRSSLRPVSFLRPLTPLTLSIQGGFTREVLNYCRSPLHDVLKFLWRRRDRIPQGAYLPVSRRCASPFTFIIQML